MFGFHRVLLTSLILTTTFTTASAQADDLDQRVESEFDWKKVKVVYNVPNRDKAVFITIDDGGSQPTSFGRWLDEQKIPITNFIMPEMLHINREWYLPRQFMTFENHTNTHAHMTLSTPEEQRREICRANRLITGIVKDTPRLFRPPRGSFNNDTRRAAAACGITHIVMWNVTADGGVIRKPGNRPLAAGDIVILHYNEGLSQSLAHVLATIKKHGLKPAFLRDYLK